MSFNFSLTSNLIDSCCFLDSIGPVEFLLLYIFNSDWNMYYRWCHLDIFTLTRYIHEQTLHILSGVSKIIFHQIHPKPTLGSNIYASACTQPTFKGHHAMMKTWTQLKEVTTSCFHWLDKGLFTPNHHSLYIVGYDSIAASSQTFLKDV